MFDVGKIRLDFPILQQEIHGKKLTYLDNAATTQLPRQVVECIVNHYFTDNANIHRGIHHLSEVSSQKFEDARKKVQRFINAHNKHEVCFTYGVTNSINLVAESFGKACLKEGDEIIVSQLEHHSNFVPWQIICRNKGAAFRITPAHDGELDLDSYAKLLNKKTKLVAITQVSNVTGTITPVKKIIEMAHSQGVPVLVDGAQGIRHEKTDVQFLDCDFYCFSGHKMMAPTGTGVLYAKAKWMDFLQPVSFGGGMVDKVTSELTLYNKAPHKFEAGTPNYSGIIALGKAIDYLEFVGRQDISDYESSLLKYTEKQLNLIADLKILGKPSRRAGAISFAIKGTHSYDLSSILDKYGIAVRSGNLCAQPLLRSYDLDSAIRVSPAFYNTKDEIDVLIRALNDSCRLLKKWKG